MCGISALFALHTKTDLTPLKAMTDTVRHRGPDGEGYVLFCDEVKIYGGAETPKNIYHYTTPYCPKKVWEEGQAGIGGFGHRRLTILDLSPHGHQPMCTPDRRFWITFNGEIYNYIEIRDSLIKLGHRFQSHSDTEVILHAYQEWGKDCLQMFNGMFAFLIFDTLEKKLFGARDRFGVKPLYYWISPEGFIAFGSEIKQFTPLPGWQAFLNRQAGYDFLNWAVTDHNTETFFQGVRQLRGGEAFEWDLQTPLKPYRWYQIPIRSFKGSFNEAAFEFQRLLIESVKLRLRADVEVGSCLSGGLDSSSIVCIMNRLLEEGKALHKQRTFSARSNVKRFCESEYIESVIEFTSVQGYSTTPSITTLIETLPDLIWSQDEPFNSASIYAQWEVFRLVHQQEVKVMLDGQGADELLAGYKNFFPSRMYELFRALRWNVLFCDWKKAPADNSMLFKFFVPERIAQPLQRLYGKPATSPYWIELAGISDRDPVEQRKHKTLNEQCGLQMTRSNLPYLLRYEDRNSMAHSVESRTPFLDYRLVEFAMSLPSDYKLAEGVTKRVLRESMTKILPKKVLERKDKMGFETAEEVWIKHEYSDYFKNGIRQAYESGKGFLKPETIDVADAIIDGKKPFNHLVWRIFCFGQWINRFGIKL